MIKDVEAVIFDMDGVLLDTESMCDKTWIDAADAFGLTAAQAMHALSQCRGRNVDDTLQYLSSTFTSAFDARGFINRTTELFRMMEAKDGIPLMKGAHSALRYLKDSGYLLALASSTKGDTVRRQLKTARLLDFFKTITSGDTVVHSKPDGEIYTKAAASLALPPAKCAAIEDSPNGVRSAAAAGMKCIMIPDREIPTKEIRALTHKVLSSLEEIRTVL